MKARELENLGIPRGEVMKLALSQIAAAAENSNLTKARIREGITAVAGDPSAHLDHPQFGQLARALASEREKPQAVYTAREHNAPWKQWGADLEPDSVQQMANACELPVSVAGALMPDAHVGYGLPIGGVLATQNAVIPYAVGVDIACRMKMTVLDVPGGVNMIRAEQGRLINAIERETRFGVGAEFRDPLVHPVLDEDWSVSPITHHSKRKA